VELAVILYVAEEIDERVTAALDLRDARREVADAARALIAAAAEPDSDADSVAEAAAAHRDAWTAYRNFLYEPLHRDEALLAMRLERVAREAKVLSDEREAALARVRAHPAIAASIAARHGSVEAWAADRAAADEARIQRDTETMLASYERNRAAHLADVYEEGRRDGDLLDGVRRLDWLLAGAQDGAAGDPGAGRTAIGARFARARARGAFDDALEGASRNRLQAYDDEAAILAALAGHLRARGDGEAAASLDAARAIALRLKDADARLATGDGVVEAGAAGLAGSEALR